MTSAFHKDGAFYLPHFETLIARLDKLTQVLAQFTPDSRTHIDTQCMDQAIAFRWEHGDSAFRTAHLAPVQDPVLIGFHELCHVDRQVSLIHQNTLQFVRGAFANNVLLTGARGTGKSSLVRACLHAFHVEGLRLIEVEKQHLNDLPHIVSAIRGRKERFIIYCDDLSFEEGETGYKGLKTVLDGSVAGPSSNVLIYATSNRRHMITEHTSDNLEFNRSENGELHPGDTIEEKISLADRFGIHITFYSFSQDEYLKIVEQWLRTFGFETHEVDAQHAAALQWAARKGTRSGRVALQFARDCAGRKAVALQ